MTFCTRRSPLATLLGVGIVLMATSVAQADPAPPFAALLAEAKARAPRLVVAGAAIDQARGLAQQSRAYPNPTAGVTVENFNGTKGYRGFNQGETTVTIGQPIELWGKRNARIRAGEAGVTSAEAQAAQTVLDYSFDLALNYAQADASARRVKLAEEMRQLANEDLRISKTLVDAGRESQLRMLQAQAAATAASANLEATRAEQADAFSRLSALSGSPAPYTSIQQSLLTRPASPIPNVVPSTNTMPAVIAAEAARAAAYERMQSERTRWQPDVTASVGTRRFAADGSTALIASLSFPIPIWDQNQGNVNASLGELRAAEARLASARLDGEAALRTALFQLSAADARVEAANQAEETSSQSYRLTRTGYESGRLPLIELLNAQRALALARTTLIEAQVARVRAEADLARLQGRTPFSG